MRSSIARLRTAGQRLGERLATNPVGLAIGLALLAVCVLVDALVDERSAALVGTYVVAPLVAAMLAGPGVTTAVGVLAIAATLASPSWNMSGPEVDQAIRVGVTILGTAIAIVGATVKGRFRGRSERLRLLDAVGAVADGSLPLAETLERVTEEITPMFGDICIVDAVHDGRVTRIATRVSGRDDASEIEERVRRRTPSLPEWLVNVERPWRSIPRWWPRVREEDLRRMSHSPDDLEFLRSLGMRSTITAPIRARDRNLGTLTMVVAWSGRRYDADDLHFAQILASRIGLALDNAGLFSDLESVERRMDSVMSILDEAVVIHGPDSELVFANPAAARQLGYSTSEEAISTPSATLRERVTIRDEAGRIVGAEALAGRPALTGEPTPPVTLRATDNSTGQERWYRTKARAIEGPTGEILYSVTAIEDVTDVKRAESASRLLARTGEQLSHSTENRLTLERVPQLLVPDFADWCAIEIPGDDGLLHRAAIAHRDPERLQRLDALRDRHPARLAEATGVERAIETGEAQLFELTDERLRRVATDGGHLRELRMLKIRSAIVAPLTAAGVVLGVLELVNHDDSRRFDDDDLATAQEVARRVGLALENVRIADERARVADALQRELLPPSLPRMSGWEMATMYEPAGEINEVGGDFYEVFPVADGWAVVLGDVSGRGAAAAALTAEARHTIRTAGTLSGDPCRGLYMLDENLRSRDDAALCSVALLVLPHRADDEATVRVYLAGHPHPMLLREGRAEPVGSPGPLLGIVEAPDWIAEQVRMGPGDQLVLYTDGVIEARRQGGERFGTERLRGGLAGCSSPDGAVQRVRSALATFGAVAREDDAALVAIRRTPISIPDGGSPARDLPVATSP
ncbi:MAG: SpoIIE family protein phosphatase [Solirubrobacterales bacterium]|nr:SpoIIE family protein phosphatase [Solirubrobacterales bacterium]